MSGTDAGHLQRVQAEFTRQADTFDAYAPRADLRVEARFRAALGERPGQVLDLACGPGVVTAAVAATASAVVGFDATPAMLERARQRCREAGLDNVRLQQGDAGALPFGDGAFDAVVTRLAIHHFDAPATVLAEVFRVLRPGGKLVVADVLVSDDPAEAALQNAIENLRDPSHVRMLADDEMQALLAGAGFQLLDQVHWQTDRGFDEWLGIANDARRAQSLRVVARRLAAAGEHAGMGLRLDGDALVFFHRWTFIVAERPAG